MAYATSGKKSGTCLKLAASSAEVLLGDPDVGDGEDGPRGVGQQGVPVPQRVELLGFLQISACFAEQCSQVVHNIVHNSHKPMKAIRRYHK